MNHSLEREGDTARVRFMTSGPSWYEEDNRWHILAFWELPDPEGSVWPMDLLWGYRRRIQGLFDEDEIRVESYFRTGEELESGEHHTGWRIPEPV